MADLSEGALPLDAVTRFVPGDAAVLYDPKAAAVYLVRPTGAARRLRRPTRLFARRDLREALAAAARMTGGQERLDGGAAGSLLWQASALLSCETLAWAAAQPEARRIGAPELARRMLAAAPACAVPRRSRRAARQRAAAHRAVARLAAARLQQPEAPGTTGEAGREEREGREGQEVYVTTTCTATLTERWRVTVPPSWDGEEGVLLRLLGAGGPQVLFLGEQAADEHDRAVASWEFDPNAPHEP